MGWEGGCGCEFCLLGGMVFPLWFSGFEEDWWGKG